MHYIDEEENQKKELISKKLTLEEKYGGDIYGYIENSSLLLRDINEDCKRNTGKDLRDLSEYVELMQQLNKNQKSQIRTRSFYVILSAILASILVVGILYCSYHIGYIAGYYNHEKESKIQGGDTRSDEELTWNDAFQSGGNLGSGKLPSPGANDLPSVYEKAIQSVVGISVEGVSDNGGFFESEFYASGSGMIFSDEGDYYEIATNYHVIEGGEKIEIIYGEFIIGVAEVIGVDAESDLALLKLSKDDVPKEFVNILKPIVFANSDAVRVGDMVMAIGNPIGYQNSATFGIVSALERDLMGSNFNRFLQTDASINPGNSGGVLVNMNGDLIGINTAKASRNYFSDDVPEGIGFAIPSSYAHRVLSSIAEIGYYERPFLGIAGRETDGEGAIIMEVLPDTPASKSGIKEGDVIVQINDQNIYTMSDLMICIANFEMGDEITVVVLRGDKELEFDILLDMPRPRSPELDR